MAYIDYPTIMREQMTGIVRRVLEGVAVMGLPSGHALYLEFVPSHSRAVMPGWLVSKFPTRMAVVLENQFWDLSVCQASFSVTLTFGSRKEALTIPFDALLEFRDAPAGIALKFNPFDENLEQTPRGQGFGE